MAACDRLRGSGTIDCMKVPFTALLLALALQSHAQTPPSPDTQDRIGTFKQVQGETWVGTTDARRAVQPGDGLRATERVGTGRDGSAVIVLRDGTALTVGPNSLLDLSRFQFDATTQQGNVLLDLLQGSMRVVTGLLAKVNPDLFKVQTPTAVVGVRGTDFIVETQAAR